MAQKARPIVADFSGTWLTTFGRMSLTQEGARAHGVYDMGHTDSPLDGEVEGDILRFRYREPDKTGEGWFHLQRYGKFVGQWREEGAVKWASWQGQRGFDGLWATSFGPVRLFHEQDRIHGFYEGPGSSTIDGRLAGSRFVFGYREPRAQGEGWFELSDDGMKFHGQWRAEGTSSWELWEGERILPQPRLMWLVVLEDYWQRDLFEAEYAFGNMLREYFARLDHVQVRQRFFNNGPGLAKWCRELLYLAEPVVLVLATHGTPDGLTAQGELIDGRPVVDSLRQADNVLMLHFSSCLVLEDGSGSDFTRLLREQAPFPISGYATTVDWAASALIEFTYLDMILARGLAPEAAAAQVTRLLAFAGDRAPAESPFPAAHFRFWKPNGSGA
jgi:hypothetical protein